jgi:hypothetical protein
VPIPQSTMEAAFYQCDPAQKDTEMTQGKSPEPACRARLTTNAL